MWAHVLFSIFAHENNTVTMVTKQIAFHNKSEMVWLFIDVYKINRILQGHLEIQHFSSPVDKYFTSSTHL